MPHMQGYGKVKKKWIQQPFNHNEDLQLSTNTYAKKQETLTKKDPSTHQCGMHKYYMNQKSCPMKLSANS